MNTFNDKSYDNDFRYLTYREMIYSVKDSIDSGSVLEIGVGNHLVSDHLKSCGYDVTTFDIDKNLKPDVVGDLRNIQDFFNPDSFDVIIAGQVLEHIPFDLFIPVLHELKKISRNKVIISIPDIRPYFQILFHTPFFQRFFGKEYISLHFKIPRNRHSVVGVGHHFWEIGSMGITPKNILDELHKVFSSVQVKISILDRMHVFYILGDN